MSTKRLGDISFAAILPEALRDDEQFRAAAASLDGLLRRTTNAIPNLLIWARLDRERAVCIPPLQRLVDTAGGLRPLSTEMLELLAWQFHVDFREVAIEKPTAVASGSEPSSNEARLPDLLRQTSVAPLERTNNAMLERMVRESIPWHRIKGTPAAVEQALAMYNVQALVDESGTGANWAVYELELAEVPRGGTMANIVRVAEEAAPKRCWLRRVYGGFDRRPIILDRGPALDAGYLDDDSGVWDEETGVKQSFGERRGLSAESRSTFRASLGAEFTHASRAFYIDKAILDHWRLDNPTVKCHGIVGGALVSLLSLGIGDEKSRWEGPWDHRRWSAKTYAALAPFPRRSINTHRSLSKAQLVLDFARLDSSLERMDRQRVTVVDKPHQLDFTRLDQGRDDMQVRVLYLDERFHHAVGIGAPRSGQNMGIGNFHARAAMGRRGETRSGVGVTTFKEEVTGLLSLRRPHSRPDGMEWAGPWPHRMWRDTGCFLAHTTNEGETS